MIKLRNKYPDTHFMIVGAGSSIKRYSKEIKRYLKDHKPIITIGINNITSFIKPNFHLWTNNGRLKEFGKNINKESTLLLGQNIKKELKKNRKYIEIKYTDKKCEKLAITKNKIKGYFRTAGCLAICLAYYIGAKEIDIIGMDGYTFIPKEKLKKGKGSQHLYGSGATDNNDWKTCQEKDVIVYNALRDINDYGIKFQIITPTVFKDFYNNRLEIYGL